MLKIKICGLKDPSNVKEIANTHPDFMGFIFYPESCRFVGYKPDDSLFRKVPSEILKTGVFVNEEPSVIINIINKYGLDTVQLHGNETEDYCNYLKKAGLKIIKAFGVTKGSDFTISERYMDVCDYFLFDTKTASHGGSGRKFDWEIINEYHLNKPFFLGGGIGPEDISLIKKIKHQYLFAVDINSRFELSPGIKDIKKVRDFINAIKK